MDLSLEQLALLACVYCLAFTIKGVFGYGAAPALIILGSTVVPPHHAVLLAGVSNLISQVQFIPEALRHGDRKLSLIMALSLLPATLLGVWWFASIGSSDLSLVAGVIIMGVLLLEMSGLAEKAGPALQANRHVVGPFVGFASGIISGLIGAGSLIFMSVYIRFCVPEKLAFRATMMLIATLLIFWRTGTLAVGGLLSLELLAEAALLAPVGYLAGKAGSVVANRLSTENYFWLYRLLLLVGAASLILRGLASSG